MKITVATFHVSGIVDMLFQEELCIKQRNLLGTVTLLYELGIPCRYQTNIRFSLRTLCITSDCVIHDNLLITFGSKGEF